MACPYVVMTPTPSGRATRLLTCLFRAILGLLICMDALQRS